MVWKIYKWYEEIHKIDLEAEDAKNEELEKYLENIITLKKEIKAETKVPLSYMGEYYDLIMHLELIISKINIKLVTK